MVAEITYRSMTASKKKAPISFFNSRLISVISIALALYMMGLFFIFGLISKELSVYMKENIAFSILLKEDIKEAEREAREKAAEVDRRIAAGEAVGPLAGVPYSAKDVFCTKGIQTTAAAKILDSVDRKSVV